MKAGERFIALVLGGALSVAASAHLRAEPWSQLTVRPLHAVSLDAGTKHVVSYFANGEGACRLTLLVVDSPSSEEATPATPATRFITSIDAGKTAHLDTAVSKSLRFDCAADAQTMKLTVLDRIARHPAADSIR
jgi:hypothetical protein